MNITRRIVSACVCLCLLAAVPSGCGSNGLLDPDDPVTVNFWHPYGQQMNASLDVLVDEFNDSIGRGSGVIVQVSYIADASEINDKLLLTANNAPGAPAFPDVAVIYPQIGIILAQKGRLADLSTLFSESELSRYVPEFLEEGKLGGDTQYLLPVAKSAEVLYVNATLFGRFSKDTGVNISQLSTFEGIADAAEKYYEWSGGRDFFFPENLFNAAMIGFRQLGGDFLEGSAPNLSSPLFQRIWDAYYPGAVKGGTSIFDNYGNYLMVTGEIVCCTSTTAGVTFFNDTVTYSDNTKESLELAVLPYPVFEGGEKVVLQRGGSLCVFKSDDRREYAASLFLKWLTDPEQNLRFTTQTGYLPVTGEAFGGFMERELENIESENVRKLFETVGIMQGSYVFFIPPVFDGFEGIQKDYIQSLKRAAEISRQEYLDLLETQDPRKAYEAVSQGVFEKFTAER